MFGLRNRRRPRAAARSASAVRSAVAECLEQRLVFNAPAFVWVEAVQSTAEATPQQAPGKFRFHAEACAGTNPPASVTVTFQLSGTASQCGDYSGDIVSGTVDVPVNGSADVTFDAIDDEEVEPTENVLVTLDDGSSAYSVPEVGVTGREASADIIDDDVNISVDSGTVVHEDIGADPIQVTATDYYGTPKSGIPLEIDSYNSSVLTADWDSGGSTTDLDGHATLMVAGVGQGSSPLRVKRLAKSNYGEGLVNVSPPRFIMPGSIRLKKGETKTLTIQIVDLFYNRPWPNLTITGNFVLGGGYTVTSAPGYENGKTDRNGVCKVVITGIVPQNGSLYAFTVQPRGFEAQSENIGVYVDP